MTDRFEVELRDALHAAQLPAAPEGLRRSLEGLPMGVSSERSRGWLAASTVRSMQLLAAGLAGAALMAVAVFGFWLPLSTHSGPATSQSGSPALSTSPIAASPSGGQSATPGPVVSLTGTPVPTPSITPSVSPSLSAAPTAPTAPTSSTPATVPAGSTLGSTIETGTYFNGRFVIVGRSANGTEGAWIGDGRTWQRAESAALAAMDVSHLVAIGSKLYAFGWAGSPDPGCATIVDTNAVSCAQAHTVAIAATSDGRTWTAAAAGAFGHTLLIAAAASSRGALVFGFQCDGVSLSATCGEMSWYSPDGTSWTKNAFDSGLPLGYPAWDIRTLAATSNGFYGIGGTTSWVSTDGATWQQGALPPLSASFPDERLYATSSGLIATEATSCPAYVAASSNGLAWTRVTFSQPICGPSGGDSSGIAMLGQDGVTVWGSADGKAWVRLGVIADAPVASSSQLVLGPSGVLLVTPNGQARYLNAR